MKDSLQQILDYADLGYEISFTRIFGREAVLMRKQYSYVAHQPLISEQVFDHDNAKDDGRFANLLQWLYNDIQDQEDKGVYKEQLS